MGLKRLFIVPLVLLVGACTGVDPETAREKYIVMEYAVQGAANVGSRAIDRGVIEPGSEEAVLYGDGLNTASTALNEANFQLKLGDFDNAIQYLQVGSAALAGVRPLVNRVMSDE